jgi:hypothetical protein
LEPVVSAGSKILLALPVMTVAIYDLGFVKRPLEKFRFSSSSAVLLLFEALREIDLRTVHNAALVFASAQDLPILGYL